MGEGKARTDWELAGPPDALLRKGGVPRRPFSVVRYWLPGALLGASIAAIGAAMGISDGEPLMVWLGAMAGLSTPLGYLLRMRRAMTRSALVVTTFCALAGVAFVAAWGMYGLLVCATTWAVSVPAGIVGTFIGLGFRDVARERWYHARFLP